uniref:Uncharacterized protein n=1 Tax=Cajanus cajan TaxID=3821 RepID=A0A151S5S4_CAJCA|nr:hypothetical protein KK1_028070 [Cajanus cajan]
MGSIKRERGVLKLVHPGRHIEVHREPIIASEVMRKNPRHCITRPDVFKFPWIVVKPESILHPGSVFLIVPNHTIYDLLKARTIQISTQSQWQLQSQSQSPFSQPPTNHVQDCPTLQRHNQNIRLFLPLLSPISQRNSSCASNSMSQDMENVYTYYDWGERSQNQSHEENRQKKVELVDASTSFRPYNKALKYYEKWCNKDDPLECVSSEQVTMLKSCLRRPDSMRKKLNLKVSFNLMEKEEQ